LESGPLSLLVLDAGVSTSKPSRVASSCFDLNYILVGFDLVTGLDQEIDDGGLGNRFAKLRHNYGDMHGIKYLRALAHS
jgi:hypothetical protein